MYKKIQRYVNVEGLGSVVNSSEFINLSSSIEAGFADYTSLSSSYVALSSSYSSSIPSYATKTTGSVGSLHLYAHAQNGNDNNDGLSVLTPKQSIQSVFNLVPDFVRNTVVIHLSGTFQPTTTSISDTLQFSVGTSTSPTLSPAYIVIDGGDELTTVAGPFTASATTVNYLQITGSFAPDQYSGFWINIISASVDPAANGNIVTIQSHSAGTFVPCKNFTGNPGSGSIFSIVRPATSILATSSLGYTVGLGGEGIQTAFFTQRLYFKGNNCVLAGRAQYNLFTAVIFDNAQLNHQYGANTQWGQTTVKDPYNINGTLPNNFAGFSFFGSASNVNSVVYGKFSISNAYMTYLNAIKTVSTNFGNGTRLKLVVQGRLNNCDAASMLFNTVGYATTKVEGAGIKMLSATLGSIGTGVEIKNCTGNGIDVEQSSLSIGAAIGSGNVGAGVYFHDNSIVTFTKGSVPTITGSLGEVSSSIGTSSWAIINTPTPMVDISSFASCRAI